MRGADPWCSAGQWPAALRPAGRLQERQQPLQQWFAVDAFVTLAPQSYSGRVLSESVRCALPAA